MARLIARYELTIDGKGRLAFPGLVDPHMHTGIYSPLAEDAVSESRAAAQGGKALTAYFRLVGCGHIPGFTIKFPKPFINFRGRYFSIFKCCFNWLTMNTIDPVPDQAGRILLPAWLRDEVGLGREVIVAGHNDYLGVHRGDYIETVSPAVRAAAAESLNRLGL